MKGAVIQFLATLVLSIGNFVTGCAVVWPSYVLEPLQSDHSPIGVPISKAHGNLIGSLPMMGSFVATIAAGWLSDYIGRKRTAILGGLCFVLSWSILATQSSVPSLLAGRFISGLGMGVHLANSIPMLSEFVQTNLSGSFTTVLILTYNLGTLGSYISGWLLSYNVINYLNLTVCTAFVVCLCMIKETPAHLLRNGDEKGAIASLKFYRGKRRATQDILVEIAYLKNQCGVTEKEDPEMTEKEKLYLEETQQTVEEISAWKTLCTSKPVLRATIMISVYMILLVFSGTIAVQAYAGPLFSIASPGISSHMCSILLSLAMTVGSGMCTAINGMCQRRTLMITSALLSSFFLAVLASLVRWSWGPEWLVPGAALAYCCVFQMGVANVPLVQLSESFMPKMKSLVSMISMSCLCLANFIILVVFGPSVDAFGLDGTFLMFSFICSATAIIAFLAMKETKGVPVEDIMRMYAEGYLYHNKR